MNLSLEGVHRRHAAGLAAIAVGLGVLSVAATPAEAASPPGEVWTVGLGSDGQLGQGSTANRTSLGLVSGLSNVVQVAGGREHVVALLSGGSVRTWGDGSKGAIGNGSNADRTSPVQVPGLTGVDEVAAGHYHSLALMGDGTLRTWGYNADGQLGDGTTTNRNSPITVSGLSNVADMAAGRDMSYAVLNSGAVRAWGRNADGELGNGATAASATPVTVSGVSNAVDVAAGRNHGLALLADGTIKAWGLNDHGQLGDGTKVNRTNAITVPGISTAVAIGAGADHSLAVLADGQVMSWGRGYRGAIGSGGTADRLQPAVVNGLPHSVVAIDAGRDHSLAVTSGGQLWAWGFNSSGQLGDGKTANRLTAYQVAGVADAVEAGGGFGYTVVLRGGSSPGDTTPPTTPGRPSGSSTVNGRVDLTFSASNDDQASSLTYRIFRDGGSSPAGTVNSASSGTISWSDPGLTPGGSHTYRVDASDGTNTSPLSSASDPITVAGGGGGGNVVVESDFSDYPGAFTNTVGLSTDASRFAPGDSAPSVRATPSSAKAYAYRAFGSSETSVCASIAVRLENVGSKAVSPLKLRSSSGVVAQVNIAPTRKVTVRSTPAKKTYSSGYTLPLNTWVDLQLCVSTGSGGSMSLTVDGAAVRSWSANTGSAPMTRVQVGDNLKKSATYNLDALRVTH